MKTRREQDAYIASLPFPAAFNDSWSYAQNDAWQAWQAMATKPASKRAAASLYEVFVATF